LGVVARGIWVAVLVALAGCLLAPGLAEAQSGEPPSIVLILTDDQRWDTLWAMPTVDDELVAHGVTFSNAFVTNPLCCPSRATILTGRYSHGTGVYSNGGAHGGFAAFRDGSTIATWLQARGYRTALVGKYLNRYSSTYIPPGWDDWVAFTGAVDYFDYSLNANGVIVNREGQTSDYSTDVLAAEATSFIRSTNGPLFLMFTPNAPHFTKGSRFETTPAPRHAGAFAGIAPWRPPSYGEPDVSDKPPFIKRLPPFTTDTESRGDAFRQSQLESLLAVDEAVGEIVDALRDTGRLANTMIVFTSDNGYAWGEHRWFSKVAAYEESIRVPLVIRYDPLTTRRRDGHLTVNVDLAPTFAEIAGARSPGAQGKSLVGHLASQGGPWRRNFVLEQYRGGGVPTYCGVRSGRYTYVQYRRDTEELYDLVADPYQLDNRAKQPALRRTLVRFRTRARTLCNPPPPGFTPRSPCLISGNGRANVLIGTRYFDYICGFAGADRVRAGRGDDLISSAEGDDIVHGGKGADVIKGGPGADRLYGEPGGDTLRSVAGGRDIVDCGEGVDTAFVDRRDVTAPDCEKLVRR
jgi:arylsulfatase A-like enzyme